MSGWLVTASRNADRLVGIGLDATIKGTLILAAASAIAWLLRRRGRAAERHLAWSLAVVGTLALPVLSAALPAWTLALPSQWRGGPSPASPPARASGAQVLAELLAAPTASSEAPGSSAGTAPGFVARGVATAASTKARPVDARVWWLGAWLVGAAVVALPSGCGLVSLGRLRRSSAPVDDGPARRLFDRLAASLGLRRPVLLVRSRRRAMPMTWGVWTPVVLLPKESESWPEERLTMVFLHELAHVRRWDFATQLLARVACAVYWFHPLAWLAAARMRVEQERASDDLALGEGFDPADYAAHLLEVLAGASARRPGLRVAPAAASSSSIERRLRAILDPAQDRRPLARRQVAAAVLVATGLLLPLATGRLGWAAAPPPEAGPAKDPGAAAPEAPGTPAQDEVLDAVRRNSLRPPDESALRRGAIKGMIDALNDPYAAYLSPDEVAELDRQVRGTLTGIGAQLAVKDGRVTVVTPLPGSPAYRAGVRPDDRIVEVDGQPARGDDLPGVVRRILGPSGTSVKLKVVHRDGREAELAVERGPIVVPTVKGFRAGGEGRWEWLLDPAHKIGYASVAQFTRETPRDLRGALEGLKARGLNGLILDLRSCPGGLLDSAVEAARLFVSGGTIVTTRGRDGVEQAIRAEPMAAFGDVPLVVLVNEQTASAAEIFAGALKENGRAVVVGTRTHGKASVQSIVALKDGRGALRLTTAYYLLPGGRNIDRAADKATWGVDPTDGDVVALDERQTAAMLERRQRRERVDGPDGAPAAAPPGGIVERIERDEADPQLAAALRALIAKVDTGEFPKVGRPAGDAGGRQSARDLYNSVIGATR